MPSVQVVIPESSPMVPLLEQTAKRRGYPSHPRGKLRKSLPRLARDLMNERLRDLKEHGDPFAVTPASPAVGGA